jgi:hypothetical protein
MRRSFEHDGNVLPDCSLRFAVLHLCEQRRGLLQVRERLLAASDAIQDLSEHTQRLRQAVGVASTPTQLDCLAVQPQAVRQPAGLEVNMRD